MDVLDLAVSQNELQQLDCDLRQVWPGPTICNVEGCLDHFETLRAYLKHWKAIHTAEITIYSCLDCGRKFPTSNKVRRHLRLIHAEPVGGPEGYDKLSKPNQIYIHPGQVVPFKVAPNIIRTAVSRKRNDPSKCITSNLQRGVVTPRDEEIHFHFDDDTPAMKRTRSSWMGGVQVDDWTILEETD